MERDYVVRTTTRHIPPPFDLHPDFPTVLFNREGEPQLDLPAGAAGDIVCQVVPSHGSVYTRRYRGGYRAWEDPPTVHSIVAALSILGYAVVIHSRVPGVRVMGVSRGLPRFVCGRGVAVFVIREFGALPDGVEVEGRSVGGMVVALGVPFPSEGGGTPALHIFPAEYLADPVLPGLPAGLTQAEEAFLLPPPPKFSPSGYVDSETGLDLAWIDYGVSEREYQEGGGVLFGFAFRGRSYYDLHGFSL